MCCPPAAPPEVFTLWTGRPWCCRVLQGLCVSVSVLLLSALLSNPGLLHPVLYFPSLTSADAVVSLFFPVNGGLPQDGVVRPTGSGWDTDGQSLVNESSHQVPEAQGPGRWPPCSCLVTSASSVLFPWMSRPFSVGVPVPCPQEELGGPHLPHLFLYRGVCPCPVRE